jgi:hypothetical protein
MKEEQDDLTLVYMFGYKNGKDSMKAENERLRMALKYYSGPHEFPNHGPWGVNSTDFGQVATAALEAKDE